MMYWLLLLIVPVVLGVYAQMRVSSAYQKNLQIQSRGHITGAEAAQAVMHSAGIDDVEIVEVEGRLSDHYDPMNKRLALSSDNYRGTSLAALGVAAHESGHAIQHKVGYAMMSVRQNMVPVMQFAAPVAYFFTGFGFYLLGYMGHTMMMIGIAALSVMTVFQLVTLPVEFDASRRAKVQLVELGILGRDEMPGVNETLDAAALTYVAAFVSSLGQLLHLLLMLNGGSRRSD
jgi:Zn-dependent membrane protease YugP